MRRSFAAEWWPPCLRLYVGRTLPGMDTSTPFKSTGNLKFFSSFISPFSCYLPAVTSLETFLSTRTVKLAVQADTS